MNLEERIKKRQRPKVKSRGSVVDNLLSSEVSSEEQTVVKEETKESSASTTTEEYQKFKLSQATLRFEENVAKRLQTLCKKGMGNGKISKEAFIEAMFLYVEKTPEKLSEVLQIAEERTALRKRAANWKRGQTMAKNAESE